MLGSQDVSASRHTKRNCNVSRLDHYCVALARFEALLKTRCAKLGRRTSRDRSASLSQCHTAAYFFVVQPAIVNFSIPHESMHASASRPVPLPNHTAQDTCPAISKSARRKRTTSNVRPVAFSDWALWAPRMPSCKPLHTNPPSSSRCMDFSRIVSSVHRSVVRPWWCGRRSMFAVKPEDNNVRVSIEDRQRRPNHLNTHRQL